MDAVARTKDAADFWQRFKGTFEDDDKTIAGCWEKSDDGSSWETDFDLTSTKTK